jgi:hypothetical protein
MNIRQNLPTVEKVEKSQYVANRKKMEQRISIY